MSTQVMRVSKIKSGGAMAGLMRHSARVTSPVWVDSTLEAGNRHWTVSEDHSQGSVMLNPAWKETPDERLKTMWDRFAEKLPDKTRKNAVLGLELIFTTDFPGMEKIARGEGGKQRYAELNNDLLKWIAKEFGGSENIISSHLHTDEATPH